MIATPVNVFELQDFVRSTKRLLAVGARTKPALSAVDDSVALVSTRNLSGITEYDPGEFTFTALAGTPLSDIISALAEKGQYLPFDPPLADLGATLGGTISAGLNGPGRFRFGGIRDFILGVQFIDGAGNLIRGGAKVVKNAAGFDLPKFMIGTCGRFGVITEATFKVFPCPREMVTISVPCPSASEAVRLTIRIARSRWEFDAFDYSPHDQAMYGRLRGTRATLDRIAQDILSQLPGASVVDCSIWKPFIRWDFGPSLSYFGKATVPLIRLQEFESLCRRELTSFHASPGSDCAYFFPSGANSANEPPNEIGKQFRTLVLRCKSRINRIDAHYSTVHQILKPVFDAECKFP